MGHERRHRVAGYLMGLAGKANQKGGQPLACVVLDFGVKIPAMAAIHSYGEAILTMLQKINANPMSFHDR